MRGRDDVRESSSHQQHAEVAVPDVSIADERSWRHGRAVALSRGDSGRNAEKRVETPSKRSANGLTYSRCLAAAAAATETSTRSVTRRLVWSRSVVRPVFTFNSVAAVTIDPHVDGEQTDVESPSAATVIVIASAAEKMHSGGCSIQRHLHRVRSQLRGRLFISNLVSRRTLRRSSGFTEEVADTISCGKQTSRWCRRRRLY